MSIQTAMDRRALNVNRNITSRIYWRNRLEHFAFSTYFGVPGEISGKAAGNEKYEQYSGQAAAHIQAGFNQVAASDKARHLLLLAALTVFARKYSAIEDVAIFTPAYTGEPVPDRAGHIIPVRMHDFDAMTFRGFLNAVKDNLMQDLKQGDYPLEKIVLSEGLALGEIPATGMLVEEMHALPIFDKLAPGILFSFQTKDQLRLSIRYDAYKYNHECIELLPALFFELLHSLIHNREEAVGNIALIVEAEKQQLLAEFNNAPILPAHPKTITGLLEAQVERDPYQEAIVFNGNTMRLWELNERVNKFAWLLLRKGLVAGQPVVVLLERSTDFIISVLAVLKAGCCYLPVDPETPDETINYILRDSDASWVITKKALVAQRNITLPAGSIYLDNHKLDITGIGTHNPGQPGCSAICILPVYGPGERPKLLVKTHMNNLHWVLDSRQCIDIGKTLFDKGILITDKSDQLLPVGAVGEILLSGNDWMPAYLNKVELTAQQVASKLLVEGLPAYRTGDRGRRLPGGKIEWLGKLDHGNGSREEKGPSSDPAIRKENEYKAPSNGLEEKLADIWSSILKLEKKAISVNASFFELGGHSLRAMTLVNKIKGELGIEISIRDVFERKDIVSLAQLLTSSGRTLYTGLKKAEKKEYYNLSIAQMRLYYFYELDKQSLTFNMPDVVRITGDLDRNRLEKAFYELIKRHEVLHSFFEIINGQPVQLIAGTFEWQMEYFYSTEEEVDAIVERFIRPFDLSHAPLFRVGLITTSPGVHYMMIDMHHIISDGTSIGLLINDFMALYQDMELPVPALNYKDYAVWQQSTAYQRKIAGQKEFWVREFSETIIPLDLPVDFARPSTTEGDLIQFNLSLEETRQLRAMAEHEVATISMLILSMLSVLLSKMANQEDIVIGMTVAGREQFELETMIGMFPVVLPLRTRPEAGLSFREFLNALKTTFLATFDNQSYQYEELARELNLERNTSRNPWFDVMYLYQNYETSQLNIPGLNISAYKEQNIVAYEKLNFTVSEDPDQIFFSLLYSKALFKKESIERLIRYFKIIVRTVIDNADIKLSDIKMLANDERKMLQHAAGGKKTIARDKVFADLFAEQVKRTPGNIVVEHNGVQFTYQEFYTTMLALASVLWKKGVQANISVAVILPRGIGMLTCITAIFHAGGIYVPVDVEFPKQRVMEILQDSTAEVIIASTDTIQTINELRDFLPALREVICIDQLEVMEPVQDISITKKSVDDLAYIIYTSGTTGKPKGVMIHQLGMINHLYGLIDILSLKEGDTIAQTASPCFDISVWQFLAALITGGRTFIIDKGVLQEPHRLLEELQQGAVTIFQSVPSLLMTFLDELPNNADRALPELRWMIPTGEPLSVALVKKWYDCYPGIKLLNAYGPAEASDDVTTYVVALPREGQLAVPVGKPLQNMQVYIMDKFLHLCPVGVKGEICVSGLGVGKGYWKDEEKTRQAFVPNPFAGGQEDADHAVLYKTGDFGYYLEDGNIVCTGRADDQVKIRGIRIELKEIESYLLTHESIRETVLVTKEWAGNKHLVAYYVADREISASALRTHLSGKLPAYMVPSYFIYLAQLPLTLNGKVDKKALPDPEIRDDNEYIAPSNDLEKRLAAIWEDILHIGQDQISMDTSFFYIGGHSLNSISLINRIYTEFGIKVSLKEFFMKPTISFLTEYIEAHTWLKEGAQTEIL